MIQIRLDAGEQPVEAVFSQHKGAERQDWSFVAKAQGAAATPLVYVARGSHACYFRAGTHWTGVWWDHADGKGPTIAPALVDLDPAPAWALWPGFWGDTKATPSPLDSSSPRGPVGHAQWSNPAVLVETARRTAAARAAAPRSAVPPTPAVSARRAGTGLVVRYDTAGTSRRRSWSARGRRAPRRPRPPTRSRSPRPAASSSCRTPRGTTARWRSV